MPGYLLPDRRCPACGSPVPELLSPSGRRRRGRPRVFCSPRCRLGDRQLQAAPDPDRRRAEVAAFAAAVRAAIAGRGLPLRELAADLAAGYPSLASSVATLSAWQTGTSAPPWTLNGRDRLLALERCLGLPAGDLALLMPGGAAVPTPRPPVRAGTEQLAARRARLAHLLGALAGPQQVLPVSVAKEVRLDAAGRPLSVRVTGVVRAAHDGVDRLWYVEGRDPRLRASVVAAAGCRAGRRVPEPGSFRPGLVATELVLDRPLACGERHELAFLVRYEWRPGQSRLAEPVFCQALDRPLERLDLTVSFDPRAEPAVVLAARWRPRDGAEVARREVTVPGCRAYQLVVADPGPGAYGWRWMPARVRLPAPGDPGTSAA